jgi:hypothetical protein
VQGEEGVLADRSLHGLPASRSHKAGSVCDYPQAQLVPRRVRRPKGLRGPRLRSGWFGDASVALGYALEPARHSIPRDVIDDLQRGCVSEDKELLGLLLPSSGATTSIDVSVSPPHELTTIERVSEHCPDGRWCP